MSTALSTGSSSYAQTYGERPTRGVVGMACLILAESALFIIFVVAYVFYLGKSLSGPTPREVLTLPIIPTVCLLSSSWTVHAATAQMKKTNTRTATVWLGVTVLLGTIFLCFTAYEWFDLIAHKGLTIRTNLFGTTFYALIGLHAFHVVVGLAMLLLVTVIGVAGKLQTAHSERVEILSYYWHFVDAIWVLVFSVVYVFGR